MKTAPIFQVFTKSRKLKIPKYSIGQEVLTDYLKKGGPTFVEAITWEEGIGMFSYWMKNVGNSVLEDELESFKPKRRKK